MPKIHVEIGNPRVDGDYDLDLGYFTNRELHLIKKEAGVRPLEIEDALGAGDTDVIVALALIALRRAGRTDVPADAIWDANAGQVNLVFDEDQEEATVDPPTATGATEDDAGKPSSSGGSSSNGLASPPPLPKHIGAAG